jgi:hypothetical protein
MGFESLAMFATIWHVKVSVSRTENVKHMTLFFLSLTTILGYFVNYFN